MAAAPPGGPALPVPAQAPARFANLYADAQRRQHFVHAPERRVVDRETRVLRLEFLALGDGLWRCARRGKTESAEGVSARRLSGFAWVFGFRARRVVVSPRNPTPTKNPPGVLKCGYFWNPGGLGAWRREGAMDVARFLERGR